MGTEMTPYLLLEKLDEIVGPAQVTPCTTVRHWLDPASFTVSCLD